MNDQESLYLPLFATSGIGVPALPQSTRRRCHPGAEPAERSRARIAHVPRSKAPTATPVRHEALGELGWPGFWPRLRVPTMSAAGALPTPDLPWGNNRWREQQTCQVRKVGALVKHLPAEKKESYRIVRCQLSWVG